MNSPAVGKYFLCLVFFLVTLLTHAKQNKNAELLSYNTTVVIKNNRLFRHQSYEILIKNREGEEYTEITIPFSSLNKVSNINASVKTADGKVVKKLYKSDISERSSFPSYSFYEDEYVKEFTLKHNNYPYILHIEYDEKEDEFIYIDYWNPVLDVDIATKIASLHIEAPKDYNINFFSQLAEKAAKDSTDDNYIYTWTANYDGNAEAEQFAPPIQNYLPVVAAVPVSFRFESNGSAESWQTYGLWEQNLIKNTTDLPEFELVKIKKLIHGVEDKEQIIKTLYHYLQDETRYINISLETGGLKPYPAMYVAQNRYGDCKALSNYFRAVLQSVDIDSYYTNVYAGDVIQKIHRDVPSQQSNHVILCVPVKSDTLWLDCTSKDPFNYIGTFIQNREVFVINESNSYFSKIPALQPNQVLKERNASLKLLPGNITNAEFKTTYRGKQFELLNQLNNSYNEREKDAIFRDIVIDNSFEPLRIDISKSSRDSAKVTLNYSANSNEVYKQYGNDLVIKMLSFGIPKFEEPKDRKYPLQIDFPIYQIDKLKYAIPNGFQLASSLPNIVVNSKYGTYQVSSELSEDQVVISKSFLIKNGNYPLEEYAEFYDFIKTITQLENSTYITSTKSN